MVKKIIIELKDGEEQFPTLLQQLQKEIAEKFTVYLSEPNAQDILHGYVMLSGSKLILGIYDDSEDGKTELTNGGILITKKKPAKLPSLKEARQFLADAIPRAVGDKTDSDAKKQQLEALRQRIKDEEISLNQRDLIRFIKLQSEVEGK